MNMIFQSYSHNYGCVSENGRCDRESANANDVDGHGDGVIRDRNGNALEMLGHTHEVDGSNDEVGVHTPDVDMMASSMPWMLVVSLVV